MNQTQAVLAHLQTGQSLSSMQAFELYGVTRLSAKIFNLRRKGYSITNIDKKGTNRFGGIYKYSEYIMDDKGVKIDNLND